MLYTRSPENSIDKFTQISTLPEQYMSLVM